MEGNTLMDGQIKQAVLEALRMGADPGEMCKHLEYMARLIREAANYKPNSEVPNFYQAIQDAKFRP